MKRSLTIITLIALTLFCFLGLSFAQNIINPANSSNSIKQPLRCHNNGLKKALKLTKEQSEKARVLRAESINKIKPIIAQLKVEKLKYNELIREHASSKALNQQKEIIAKLMKQAKAIHRQNLNNFEKILTPKQKAHFQVIKIKNSIKVKLPKKQTTCQKTV